MKLPKIEGWPEDGYYMTRFKISARYMPCRIIDNSMFITGDDLPYRRIDIEREGMVFYGPIPSPDEEK